MAPTPTWTPAPPTSAPTTTPAPSPATTTPAPKKEKYEPVYPALARASSAPTVTTYLYRAQSDEEYPPTNQNMANLAGVMWYLHHEIVNNRYERRFRKTRIQRFKVKMRATQPLLDHGMHYGVRFAFDRGQCTGPYDCQEAFNYFGYFVGCNRVDEFPTQQWAGKVYYPDAIWFSLPGACSLKRFWEATPECVSKDPGGFCEEPTGSGTCTYSYESAGEISIDELEGIDSFAEFVSRGGWEYNNETDQGVHMHFWDGLKDTDACQTRMEKAAELFDTKYPSAEGTLALEAKNCDFSEHRFYSVVPRTVLESNSVWSSAVHAADPSPAPQLGAAGGMQSSTTAGQMQRQQQQEQQQQQGRLLQGGSPRR
mmetsp:Transcript_66786/g.145094  ORF Transcript_66786/g.145094 Transcript_66786/m.145094 type:complete len:368 (+) Transcript_66786:1560-2663(+)